MQLLDLLRLRFAEALQRLPLVQASETPLQDIVAFAQMCVRPQTHGWRLSSEHGHAAWQKAWPKSSRSR